MTITAPPAGDAVAAETVQFTVEPKAKTPPPPPPPQVPRWLRPPANRRPKKPRPTPREPRWWIGVVWLTVSVALLGFVAHVALFGILQHARNQAAGYAELRTTLAEAQTPLGQLDFDNRLVADGTPIALLSIPRLGMNEVVRQGTTSDVTRLGVGHRRDTPYPGQAGLSILYGRQSTYGGPFGQLSALVPGDKIRVTTGQATSTYVVLGLRRPGDPLPEALAANAGRLELVTADGPPLISSSVLYVDADLISKVQPSSRSLINGRALDPSEKVMGVEPNGWLALVFSLQWLIVAAALTRWLVQAWGRWQTWVVAAPVLLVLGATTADCAMALLPNLI